ncbi:MAG TPA: hypothetical protein VHO07_29835 [Streptosporangiaceae bacterium]|jgi:hypothetical protein|nr:hypothetical protein [Streptosporangiaceae bacterium]
MVVAASDTVAGRVKRGGDPVPEHQLAAPDHGVAYDRSGEPVEFARDLFRGDRTRVVVWTSGLAEDI